MIEALELRNFRNYGHVEFAFSDGINAVIGNNGRGKTNLLEALFFCLKRKAIRTTDVGELIRDGEERAHLRIQASGVSKAEKRVELVRGGESREAGGIKGFRVVVFQPDDVWMVKGGPEARRRCLDEAITEIRRGYRVTLSEYHRVLRQRNEALRAVRKGSQGKELVRSWNPLLYRWGKRVICERAESLKEIERGMTRIARGWGKGDLEARLYSSMGESLEDEGKSMKRMERMEDAELRRGTTLIGPHRDEIIFVLQGRNVRRECSQGEQKLVALMWRLSAAEMIRENTGEEVVLLMDDCLSELDKENRKLVIKELEKWGQVFLTHTEEMEELSRSNKIFLS